MYRMRIKIKKELKPRVILDVDPGIDDTIAIICALFSPCLEVIGITTVKGNVDASQGYRNVLHTIQMANRKNIPVIEGQNKWMDNRPLPPHLKSVQLKKHGEDGIGNQRISKRNSGHNKVGNMVGGTGGTGGEDDEVKGWKQELEHQGSPLKIDEFIKDIVVGRFQSKGEKVSIIATGPLTNIAKALENPSFAPSIEEICIMGGSFGVVTENEGKENAMHNTREPAEFNFYCDPLAVKAIIEAKRNGLKNTRVSIVGLDVTQHQNATLNSKFIQSVTKIMNKNDRSSNGIRKNSNTSSSMVGQDSSSPTIRLILSLLNFKCDIRESFYLHDVVSLWMFERPSSFLFKQGSINIHLDEEKRGQVEFIETTTCCNDNNLLDFFIAREIRDRNAFGNYLQSRITSIIHQSKKQGQG
jgi:inosine-uridine nucleoside N-ribohydrolase